MRNKAIGVPITFKATLASTIVDQATTNLRRRVVPPTTIVRDNAVRVGVLLRQVFVDGSDVVIPRYLMWVNLALLIASVTMLTKLISRD